MQSLRMEDDFAIGATMLRIRRKLPDEDRKRLESAYGVRIHDAALTLSCRIVKKHFRDVGGSFESREGSLHRMAAYLLETACSLLRSHIDSGEEDELEKKIDAVQYGMLRSQIEARELRKEKDPRRNFWLLRVEQELKKNRHTLDLLIQRWKPLLMLQKQTRSSVEYTQQLQSLRQEILSCSSNGGVPHDKHSNSASIIVDKLETLVALLSRDLHRDFEKVVTVGSSLIAKVASPLTGFPTSWLLGASKPPLKDLATRLSRRQVGNELAILTVAHTLSRVASRPRPTESGSATRPIGSFLFLCARHGWCWRDDRHGGLQLAESLANELFDGQDKLIHFDLSDYTDPHSASRLLGAAGSQCEPGALGQLTEAVKSKPCSIVLFTNIDDVHTSVIDILIEISSCGRLTDGQGSTIDFTKTLVIMTSKLGMDKHLTLRPEMCRCSKMVEELPIKELLDCHPDETRHRCDIVRRLEMVHKQLKPELFEQLDDIVLFSFVPLEQGKAAARLWLRDIAGSMPRIGLVIYPSEAALVCILTNAFWCLGGEKAITVWLEENVGPALRAMCEEGEINDNHIIYVDTLVGTRDLSYRLVKCEDFVEDLGLKQLRESWAELRVLCRKEKQRIKRIYSLLKKIYELKSSVVVCATTDFGCVDIAIQEAVSIIDFTIQESNVSLVADEEMVVQRVINEEGELRQGDEPNKKAKKGLECLKARLHSRSWDQAIDVIAAAALRIIDLLSRSTSNSPVLSFLFFGLTCFSKAKLVKGLAENFVTDDGANLLIQIDLSEYSDSGSLSRLMDALQRYAGGEDGGMQLPEDVKMKPCSILFLDQVEKAHTSVFSALLSVLEDNMLRDHHGRTFDFRDTIVIITSDIGNKNIFACLVDNAFGNKRHGAIEQEEVKEVFRWELLTRVDELVFLNPFAAPDDQGKKVARISMSGPHLKAGSVASAFFGALSVLFLPVNNHDLEVATQGVARYLSLGLIERGSCS